MGGEDHPIEPDALEPCQAGAGGELRAHGVEKLVEFGGWQAIAAGGLPFEEPVDAGFRSFREGALERGPRGGEGGAAVEMCCPGKVPPFAGTRLKRLPGARWILPEGRCAH